MFQATPAKTVRANPEVSRIMNLRDFFVMMRHSRNVRLRQLQAFGLREGREKWVKFKDRRFSVAKPKTKKTPDKPSGLSGVNHAREVQGLHRQPCPSPLIARSDRMPLMAVTSFSIEERRASTSV